MSSGKFETSFTETLLQYHELSLFSTIGEFFRANREKATSLAGDNIRFLLIRAEKIAKWKKALKNAVGTNLRVHYVLKFAAGIMFLSFSV
jgi:hypothetical protein